MQAMSATEKPINTLNTPSLTRQSPALTSKYAKSRSVKVRSTARLSHAAIGRDWVARQNVVIKEINADITDKQWLPPVVLTAGRVDHIF